MTRRLQVLALVSVCLSPTLAQPTTELAPGKVIDLASVLSRDFAEATLSAVTMTQKSVFILITPRNSLQQQELVELDSGGGLVRRTGLPDRVDPFYLQSGGGNAIFFAQRSGGRDQIVQLNGSAFSPVSLDLPRGIHRVAKDLVATIQSDGTFSSAPLSKLAAVPTSARRINLEGAGSRKILFTSLPDGRSIIIDPRTGAVYRTDSTASEAIPTSINYAKFEPTVASRHANSDLPHVHVLAIASACANDPRQTFFVLAGRLRFDRGVDVLEVTPGGATVGHYLCRLPRADRQRGPGNPQGVVGPSMVASSDQSLVLIDPRAFVVFYDLLR